MAKAMWDTMQVLESYLELHRTGYANPTGAFMTPTQSSIVSEGGN